MECVYPGSFDPVTVGHENVIRRLDRMFDRVIVGVLHNPDKAGCFTVPERIGMLESCLKGLEHVEILSWDGLLVDLMKKTGVRVAVRGFRNLSDVETEEAMLRINALLLPGMETLLIPCEPHLEAVSSSVVRQVASFGGDISALVPAPCLETVRNRFSKGIY
ncbi:MAG: pantetheine-phosphate adenylyltransferase [Clostridia bacterium]|nr:pantetheine-phosphate adenylyltransferase [Clostridia bacterium]